MKNKLILYFKSLRSQIKLTFFDNLLKKFIRRLIHDIAVLFAAMVISLAAFLTIARALSPILSHHKQEVAAWASEKLGQPIEIADVELVWHHFEPVLRLKNVNLLDTINFQPVLSAEQLDLGLNLWKTLLNQRLELGLVGIAGTHLRLYHDPNQTLYISGIKPIFAFNLSQSRSQTVMPLVSDIFSIDRIYLSQIQIDYENSWGQTESVYIRQIKLNNQPNTHDAEGTVFYNNGKKINTVFLIAQFMGKTNFYQKLQGSLFLNTQQISIKQLLNWALQGSFIQSQSLTAINMLEKWQGDIRGQAWLHFNEGNLNQITAQINSISSQNTLNTSFARDQKKSPMINERKHLQTTQINTLLQWKLLTNQQWLLTLNPFQLDFNKEATFRSQILLKGTGLNLTDVSAQTLPVGPFFSAFAKVFALQLPRRLQQWSHLNPSGELSDLNWHENPLDKKDFFISGHYQNISWHTHDQIPGVSHLNGDFKISLKQGHIDISAPDSIFDAPQWFKQPIHAYFWKTTFDWQEDNQNQITLQGHFGYWPNQNGYILGTFQSLLEKQKPILWLQTQFSHFSIAEIKSLLPEKLMKPDFSKWLEKALLSGKVEQGNLLLAGNLKDFPFKNNQGVFQSNATLNDIHLHYSDKWPDLKHIFGNIHFFGSQLQINTTKAELDDIPIQTIHAQVSNLFVPGISIVTLSGSIEHTLEKLMHFINQHYQNMGFNKPWTNFNLNGPMKLALNLIIPLDHQPGSNQIQGIIETNNGSFNSPPWHIQCEKIAGTLSFIQNHFEGHNIQGYCNHNITQANFSYNFKTQNQQIALTQELSANDIQKFFPVIKNFTLQGKTGIHLLMAFSQHTPIVFTLTSDLIGLSITKDSDFSKSSDESLPIKISTQFENSHDFPVYTQIDNNITIALHLIEQNHLWQIPALIIHFGPEPVTLPHSGLWINGYFPKVGMAELIKLYQNIDLSKNITNSNLLLKIPELQQADVTIGNFAIFKHILHQVHFLLHRNNQQWLVDLASPDISGDIQIPKKNQQAVVVALEKLHLDDKNADSTPLMSHPIDPNQLPKLHLDIDNVTLDQRNLGSLSMITRPMQNGLFIDNITVDGDHYRIAATGRWDEEDGHTLSSLQGQFTSIGFLEFLKAWRFPLFMDNKNFKADFSLHWPGAPYDASLKTIAGNLILNANYGRIITLSNNAKTSNDLGKVLTLLSLESLPRRLLFNFSDLTESGYSFDAMKGNITFADGIASTDKLVIKGLVADITAQGNADLIRQQWQLLLNVTPHITASFPVIATIAGGPIAGAATYIADKLASPLVDRATTRYYSVIGSWQKPVIKKVKAS